MSNERGQDSISECGRFPFEIAKCTQSLYEPTNAIVFRVKIGNKRKPLRYVYIFGQRRIINNYSINDETVFSITVTRTSLFKRLTTCLTEC